MFDNQEHYHASDRFPSRDTLLWLNSLEKVRNVSTNYTVVNDDDYIIVDTTSGNRTVTLPPARNGRKLVISEFTGSNSLTVYPNGTEKINGASSLVTTNTTKTFKDIGGNWLAW